jgi:hypothetical protein
MLRFQNRNDRENTISKGSEFRTPILLANPGVCSERRLHRQLFFTPNEKTLKETDEYTVLLHDSHSRALETNHTE